MKRSAPKPVTSSQEPLSNSVSAKRQRCEVHQICSICQERVRESESVKTLPCNHSFHLNCAEQWLRRKPVCPNCRFKVSGNWQIIHSSDSESSGSGTPDYFSQLIDSHFPHGDWKDGDSDLDYYDSDISYEESDTDVEVDGDTTLPIGRHAMKSYAVIVVEDPDYCDWVIRLDNAYGALKRFRRYLLDLRRSGQLPQNRPSSSESASGNDDNVEVGFGRYAELTYLQLAERKPDYCSWVLRHPNTVGRMKNLQRYLRRRRQTG